MAKNTKIEVKGTEIAILKNNTDDYISLTDIARYKDPEHTDTIIQNWMRNRNTIELLGFWESIYNSNFKALEFEGFRKQAGLNSFVMTPKRWIESTNAIGIISKSGRYGGTFAHKDIAFEFASWISIEFKLYVIKEFQRLKADENDRLKLEWNLQRTLAKVNYRIHTDAIKENLIPKQLSKTQIQFIYADEADMLNVALLCLIGFAAAAVDAIAGGGGLISVPAIMTAAVPPTFVLGSNKVSSSFGAVTSAYTFIRSRKGNIPLMKFTVQ